MHQLSPWMTWALVVLLASLAVNADGAKGKCNMTINDADNCAKKLMFIGDKDNIIPANDNEMTEYCGRMQEGIRCIRQYSRTCLPAFPQQVFGMFAYDAKTVMRKQCKSSKEKNEFVRNVACFLPKPYMDPVHICVDKYTAQLEVIKGIPPMWRIPGVCCTFHQLQECIRKNTEDLCEKKTGPETVDFIMDIINGMTDDVLDFTCGPYKTLQKCDELMDPESWNRMKELVKSNDILTLRQNVKYVSPLPALVEIITNYDM